MLVVVMEAIQPSALNVADLRRQECRGDGDQGEYYLGESSLSSSGQTQQRGSVKHAKVPFATLACIQYHLHCIALVELATNSNICPLVSEKLHFAFIFPCNHMLW